MNIEGLDYNTQRKRLILPEYGREIQRMVDYAVSLTNKEERTQCAETIIAIMERMFPQDGDLAERKQKLWDHLALMSQFKLNIDYPVDVMQVAKMSERPEPIAYPANKIPVKHYGSLMFDIFERLKQMEPSEERNALVKLVANQMKRNLTHWSHGTNADEKVAADLALFTDGKIQLDLTKFKFEKISDKEPVVKPNKKKK